MEILNYSSQGEKRGDNFCVRWKGVQIYHQKILVDPMQTIQNGTQIY